LQPVIANESDSAVKEEWGEAWINGTPTKLTGDYRTPVVAFLREKLGLKGTKIGCGSGECGACTIIVNGEAVCSCLFPLHRIEGAEVLTIEGLSKNGMLHPIQSILMQHGAFQCGYCAPGVIMSLFALFSSNPQPEDVTVREALQGNICRCSGYVKLLEAVDEMRRLAI